MEIEAEMGIEIGIEIRDTRDRGIQNDRDTSRQMVLKRNMSRGNSLSDELEI